VSFVDANSLIAILIWLPVVAALLCYFVPGYSFRNAAVWLTGIVLAVVSILLYVNGPFVYQPKGVFGVSWNEIIGIADFALLAFILYIGIKHRKPLVIVLTLVQSAFIVYFEFVLGGGHAEVEPAMVIDNLAIIMSLIINIIGSLICIYGVKYIAEHEEHHHLEKTRQPRFMFWLVIFLGAMNALVFSNNLVWLLFFWEITTLCSFQLISHGLTEEAINNAGRALWMNMLGGVAFAIGIVYLFVSGGADALSIRYLIENASTVADKAVLAGISLIVFAGFTKSAQMPFQTWLLGAMVAPTPVSSLLHSSTMVKAGVYIVIRLAPIYHNTLLSDLVAVAGAFTFLMTSVLAISQSNAKRVLAYSTIANLGLIIACAGINTPLAISAAIALVIFHAVSKGLLFLCVGIIEHHIHSRDIEDMGGLIDVMPFTTKIVAIGIISMFLPPFGMLLGKWASLEASVNLPLVALLFVLASAVTVLFWIKWLGRLMEGSTGFKPQGNEDLAVHYHVSLGGLALGAVVLGILVVPLVQHVILPAVDPAYNAAGFALNQGTIIGYQVEKAIGAFTAWPLFVVLGLIWVAYKLFIQKTSAKVKPVYLCGENTGDMTGAQYLATADQLNEVSLSNYYFAGFLDEVKISPTLNRIAVIILIMLIGVNVL